MSIVQTVAKQGGRSARGSILDKLNVTIFLNYFEQASLSYIAYRKLSYCDVQCPRAKLRKWAPPSRLRFGVFPQV